jgi:hypothetical protein
MPDVHDVLNTPSTHVHDVLNTPRVHDVLTIDNYAVDMQGNTEFPPIALYQEDTEDLTPYWLADGWHRLEAAVSIGATGIHARVYRGTRRDALIHAAGANVKNGLRRTNADKRKAVELLLHDEELVKRSDSELGRIAVVDRITVRNIRKQLEASCEIHRIEEKKVTRQGKTYTQRLKNKEVVSHLKLEQQDHDGSQA